MVEEKGSQWFMAKPSKTQELQFKLLTNSRELIRKCTSVDVNVIIIGRTNPVDDIVNLRGRQLSTSYISQVRFIGRL